MGLGDLVFRGFIFSGLLITILSGLYLLYVILYQRKKERVRKKLFSNSKTKKQKTKKQKQKNEKRKNKNKQNEQMI